MRVYSTIQGDTLDLIAFKYYGYERGTTEKLYAFNPHLVDYDFILPPGIKINLPELNRAKANIQELITLWD